MHSKNVLIFDVASEYGHFRKFNTTTSPLTYAIPTRPALLGLVGAVLGIEREISAGKFKEGNIPLADLFSKEKAFVAVQILQPIQKVNIAFNLINTKTSFFEIGQRTQIEFELLKNPSFRVFIHLEDKKIFDNLTERIKTNQSHFTPYLGLSQFTSTLSFVGVENAQQIAEESFLEIITAVNLNNTNTENPIKFNYNDEFKYTSDTMPVALRSDRVCIEYAEIVTETNGKSIVAQSKHIYSVNNYGNILFL